MVFLLLLIISDGGILLRTLVNPNVSLADLLVDLILEVRNLLLKINEQKFFFFINVRYSVSQISFYLVKLVFGPMPKLMHQPKWYSTQRAHCLDLAEVKFSNSSVAYIC